MLTIANALRSRLPSAYPKLPYERPHSTVYLKKNHDHVLYQSLVHRRVTGFWSCTTFLCLIQMSAKWVQAFGAAETSVAKIDGAIWSMAMFSLAMAIARYAAKIRDRHIQWLKENPLGGTWPKATLQRERHGRLETWNERAAIYFCCAFAAINVPFVLEVRNWTMAFTVCILGIGSAVAIMRRNYHRRLAQLPSPAAPPHPNKRPDLRVVK